MEKLGYTVTGKRKVPAVIAGRGMVTKKLFVEVPHHAGEIAVCVKLDSGFTAWGFAYEGEVAEVRAVAAARELEAAR